MVAIYTLLLTFSFPFTSYVSYLLISADHADLTILLCQVIYHYDVLRNLDMLLGNSPYF